MVTTSSVRSSFRNKTLTIYYSDHCWIGCRINGIVHYQRFTSTCFNSIYIWIRGVRIIQRRFHLEFFDYRVFFDDNVQRYLPISVAQASIFCLYACYFYYFLPCKIVYFFGKYSILIE